MGNKWKQMHGRTRKDPRTKTTRRKRAKISQTSSSECYAKVDEVVDVDNNDNTQADDEHTQVDMDHTQVDNVGNDNHNNTDVVAGEAVTIDYELTA